ncbi:uncharacterized protein P884DRAFT_298284 [Thermothelomyces heterothallicus CBS 202.75]|uniref:uncharacterized protein n=1 Tax=Thermothelomyces heterothallicus CBS 202.75 TaxID=1149848 RepID=UPI0037447C05
MKRALGCAALSCAVGLIDAKALKWSDDGPRWVPAQETQLGFMGALDINPPMPTAAPETPRLRKALEARGATDNTCGFVSGVFTASLWCSTTASCVYNSINSHIGCCDEREISDCLIPTVCYDYTDSTRYSTNNGLTRWCGDSSYPHCTTYIYQDRVFTGYTLLGCAVAAGTGKVWYTALDTSSTSSSSTSESSTTTFSDTSSTSTSSDSSTSTSSSSSSTTPPVPPNPDRGTPVGAIVGGVVGGLGAIALIILVVWALLRQRNKQKNAAAAAGVIHPPPAPPAGGGPPHHDPHMSQMPPQAYYGAGGAAAGGFDPRASIAQSNGGTTSAQYGPSAYDQKTATGSSPPGSPPPPSSFGNYDAHHSTPSPPPQGQQQQYGQHGYGNVLPSAASSATQAGGFFPQQQQQHPQAYAADQQGPAPVELPVTRGDGELRELQG